MSSRSAGRGSEAARSIRLALRTSSMVAVSSASPSRCFLFWPGRRARIASPIVLATVAIPPTTQPHPLPIRRHASRRRLGCAAQETMGGERRHGHWLDRVPPPADDRRFLAAVGVPSMKNRISRLCDSGAVALAGGVLLAGAGLGLLLAAH